MEKIVATEYKTPKWAFWLLSRPLGAHYFMPLVIYFLNCALVLPFSNKSYDTLILLPMFLMAISTYYSLLSLAIGLRLTSLTSVIDQYEFDWFRFCGHYSVSYHVFATFYLGLILNIVFEDVILIMLSVLAFFGFVVIVAALKGVTTYPIRMSNILATWQYQEGGPKPRLLSALWPPNIFQVLTKLPVLEAQEQKKKS